MLSKNYHTLTKRLSDGGKLAAVLKADAYGLGALPIAKRLREDGCQHFFMATIDEAIALRKLFGHSQVLIAVLCGVLSSVEAEACVQYMLTPVINNDFQLNVWQEHATKKKAKLPAILHIDTGIQRLGFPINKIDQLLQKDLSNLHIVTVMSHFHSSDTPENTSHRKQLERVRELPSLFPNIPLSFNNSAGILFQHIHSDLSRAGRVLFGISPTDENVPELDPIMSLYATILQLHDIDTPSTVGYGATYEAMPGTRLATISIGYGDGYLRRMSNRGFTAIGGARAPIVGRISMDVTMVDVTHVPERYLYPGAKVEIVGPHCPVNDVAAHGDTLGIELLTRVGNRVKRIYETEHTGTTR